MAKILCNEDGISQGERWFLIYKYLLQYTCKGHEASIRDIYDYLSSRYGIQISDHTFYADMEKLKQKVFQLDIAYIPKRGYYVANPPFEPHELRLLVDSIQASHFLTQQKADALTEKLLQLTDQHTRTTLKRKSLIENRIRSMNDSIVKDADKLFAAISTDRKIAFRFFHYGRDGKKQYSRDGKPYLVSPFAMVWRGGFYYLYAYVEEEHRFRYFRVDRMDYISMPLSDSRSGKELFKSKTITQTEAISFGIREGKCETVKLRFHSGMVDVVRDAFGKEIIMTPVDERHFDVLVNVKVSMDFYAWLFSLGRGVKILLPAHVAEKMQEYAQNIVNMYEQGGEM